MNNSSTKYTTRIKPAKGLRFLEFKELFLFRELFYFLVWRDIKIRYKQTFIGILWVILQPLIMMGVFTILFGRFAKFGEYTEIPYSLFAFSGLLPWQLFAKTLNDSSNSLVTEQRLITKVYFPRIIIPIASCFASLVDFLIGMVILALLMFYNGMFFSIHCVWIPFFIVFMMITSVGLGIWLSALNVEYRDVKYIVPFVLQIWMFLSPVIYPMKIVPEKLRFIISLNPMTGVIDGIRWSLFGVGNPPGALMLISVVMSGLLFVSGILWFRHRERTFVEFLGGN